MGAPPGDRLIGAAVLALRRPDGEVVGKTGGTRSAAPDPRTRSGRRFAEILL